MEGRGSARGLEVRSGTGRLEGPEKLGGRALGGPNEQIDCLSPMAGEGRRRWDLYASFWRFGWQAPFYLSLWFIDCTVIVIASKSLFASLKFPYPMLLTAIHLSATGLMMTVANRVFYKRWGPPWKGILEKKNALFLFSLLFTVNIYLSNLSLLQVSLAAHQISRTLVPLTTIVLYTLLYKKRYPLSIIPSVICVVMGVVLTVRGDVNVTLVSGFILVLGCFVSSLKGIWTKRMQFAADGFDTLDLLTVLCPLACLELFVAALATGEIAHLTDRLYNEHSIHARAGPISVRALLLQGVLAGSLNFLSFRCSAVTSVLNLNIVGNVKQVATPFIAVLFDPLAQAPSDPSTLAGVFTAFVGAIWYSYLQAGPPPPPTDQPRPSLTHPHPHTVLHVTGASRRPSTPPFVAELRPLTTSDSYPSPQEILQGFSRGSSQGPTQGLSRTSSRSQTVEELSTTTTASAAYTDETTAGNGNGEREHADLLCDQSPGLRVLKGREPTSKTTGAKAASGAIEGKGQTADSSMEP